MTLKGKYSRYVLFLAMSSKNDLCWRYIVSNRAHIILKLTATYYDLSADPLGNVTVCGRTTCTRRISEFQTRLRKLPIAQQGSLGPKIENIQLLNVPSLTLYKTKPVQLTEN